MRKMIMGVVVSVLLGGFKVAAAAQLPPEIVADRELVRAERLIAEEDHAGALEAMGRILALQSEHNLTLPEEFHFKYAEVALAAGRVEDAVDSVNQYLVAVGREGPFYREALELLDEVEQIQTLLDEYPDRAERLMAEKDYEAARDLVDTIAALQEEREFTLPDAFLSSHAQMVRFTQHCVAQPEGAACWMEVVNQPECYVWNLSLQTDESATWSGACSEGWAQGTGTLTWSWVRDSEQQTREETGRLQDGQKQGDWVVRTPGGEVHEGPFVEGQRHGDWVWRGAGGGVGEGPYVEGQMHGDWVFRLADGGVHEGPFVEGQRHGPWVFRLADGGVHEGPFVEGQKQGDWVLRWANGTVEEGPLVAGKRHGRWVVRDANGGVSEGPYVDDKRHGQWVWRYASGTVEEGPLVAGKRHGRWVLSWADGDVDEGPYVEGQKHGPWVIRRDGDVENRLYRNGVRVN